MESEAQPTTIIVVTKVSTAKINAYTVWTQEEIKQLVDECAAGKSINQIAQAHRRTKGAITTRMNLLKIKVPSKKKSTKCKECINRAKSVQ